MLLLAIESFLQFVMLFLMNILSRILVYMDMFTMVNIL
jgi:hypothetical protein